MRSAADVALALLQHKGNRRLAAEHLGITTKYLHQFIYRHKSLKARFGRSAELAENRKRVELMCADKGIEAEEVAKTIIEQVTDGQLTLSKMIAARLMNVQQRLMDGDEVEKILRRGVDNLTEDQKKFVEANKFSEGEKAMLLHTEASLMKEYNRTSKTVIEAARGEAAIESIRRRIGFGNLPPKPISAMPAPPPKTNQQ